VAFSSSGQYRQKLSTGDLFLTNILPWCIMFANVPLISRGALPVQNQCCRRCLKYIRVRGARYVIGHIWGGGGGVVYGAFWGWVYFLGE